jgi:hypothetical protein
VLAMLLSCAGAFGQKLNEYEVKAAYLVNFARFVQWPPSTKVDSVEICVLGQDPFGRRLADLVAGEQVDGKDMRVKHVDNASAARTCQVLFIDRIAGKELAQIMKELSATPVLTVSDLPNFISQGGIIQFVLKDNRVRFEINLANAERVALTLNARLLNVALAVRRD